MCVARVPAALVNTPSPAPDREPPLTAYFRAAGAKLRELPDGGMVPLAFSGEVAENLATRSTCGLFDFSFMGAWEFRGDGAAALLSRLQSRDPDALQPGQIAYTLLLRGDGTIFNDATLWRLGPEHYWLMTGRKSDAAWVAQGASSKTVTVNRFDSGVSVLALQGPMSGRLLAALIGDAPVRNLAYFRFTAATICGQACHLARLGYSGELGYEILVDTAHAPALWQALLEQGRAFGLIPCGFDAANSLRIEAGYILFSAELAKPRFPVDVNLARLVRPAAANDSKSAMRLVCAEISATNSNAGDSPATLEVTSSAYSPFAQCTLALGFAEVTASAPGRCLRLPGGGLATVCALPRYGPARQRPKANPLA